MNDISQFQWDGISISILTKNEFEETVENMDPSIVKCVGISFDVDYRPEQIEEILSANQAVYTWVILCIDKKKTQHYDPQYTIDIIEETSFRSRIQKFIQQGN